MHLISIGNSRALSALDKLGAVGAFLAAAASPCCFPLLATVGGALGLGALQAWGGYLDDAIQGFVGVSALGCIFAFRQHRQVGPLSIGLASAAIVFFAFYASYHVVFIYTGLAGLAVAAIWNLFAKEGCSNSPRIELQSTITCPRCGHRKQETMPTNACLYFYECENCRAMLKPNSGDCCVFCSHGSVKCPPVQSGDNCCKK